MRFSKFGNRINALEKEVKGTFPKDFKQFLSEYDGVYLQPPAHTWAKDGHVAFGTFYYYIIISLLSPPYLL
jgi:hypothetical protein